MGESEMEVIEISPSSSEKEKRVIEISSTSGSSSEREEEEEGTPVRQIVCLKSKVDMKRFEQMEDCFILDFDPLETFDIDTLSNNLPVADHDGLSIIAEKGQVACRDYPHSRHLCLKFPFDTTPHESYCELCYCYICDSAAPCNSWTEPEPCNSWTEPVPWNSLTEPELAHCHASEYFGNWKSQRFLKKQIQQSAVQK